MKKFLSPRNIKLLVLTSFLLTSTFAVFFSLLEIPASTASAEQGSGFTRVFLYPLIKFKTDKLLESPMCKENVSRPGETENARFHRVGKGAKPQRVSCLNAKRAENNSIISKAYSDVPTQSPQFPKPVTQVQDHDRKNKIEINGIRQVSSYNSNFSNILSQQKLILEHAINNNGLNHRSTQSEHSISIYPPVVAKNISPIQNGRNDDQAHNKLNAACKNDLPSLDILNGSNGATHILPALKVQKRIDCCDKDKIKGAEGTLGNFFEGISSTPSKGSYRIEVTPRISIQEEYDDNIFLRKTDIVSDFTTTLSPGIKLVANSDTNGIDLDYEFGWVKYHKGTRNDYIRHSGGLKVWQQLGNHLRFQLEDYYTKSDDILAAINQIPVSQRIPDPETLQAYQTNRARALLEYQFGPGKQISAGYTYNITDNKDPNLEDITEYGPFANLSYWFDQRDGLEFDYTFSRYDYGAKGTAAETRPDLESHDVLGRYIHRFAEKTSALAQYGLFIRNFPRCIRKLPDSQFQCPALTMLFPSVPHSHWVAAITGRQATRP